MGKITIQFINDDGSIYTGIERPIDEAKIKEAANTLRLNYFPPEDDSSGNPQPITRKKALRQFAKEVLFEQLRSQWRHDKQKTQQDVLPDVGEPWAGDETET